MRKAIYLSVFSVIVSLLLLQGCALYNPNEILPTRTPSPTQQICPTIALSTPVAGSLNTSESKLIVVLFENNSAYKPYLLKAFDDMNSALELTMQPGDKFFMLDMSARNFESAVVAMEQVEMVSAPIAPPTPKVQPTITATLPVVSTPQGSFAQLASTQSANATATIISIESTKSAFEYQCAYQSWNEQYLAISQEWEKQKNETVQNFVENLKQEQSTIEIGNGALGTDLWEGLSHASLIMENECDKFDRCMLIILSDMQENRSTKPKDLYIDLRNVEILSVMLNCKLLYSPECGKWIEVWKEYLFSNDINVKSFDFINGEELERVLIQTLSQ